MEQMDCLKRVNIKDKINMFNKQVHSLPTEQIESQSQKGMLINSLLSGTKDDTNSKARFLKCQTMHELTKTKEIDNNVLKDLRSWLGESFCEGFFIASFPYKNGKVAEKSQEYISSCGHKQCSMLPAMEPEIMVRYPLKDTKTLELNSLAATICFPSGIKVCYNDEEPKTVRNYNTPITNQQGERYYMMTYHFYHKMFNSEFSKLYEINPLKHHLMKFADGYIGLEIDDKLQEKIEKNLELCQELGFKDFVYIPYCICLISKFPFMNQMEKCLQCLYRMISSFDSNVSKEINEVIMFLIHSIPIPEMNTKIRVYLPFDSQGVDITCPKLKDVNIVQNLTKFFNIFTIEQIITIFRLMLLEKKILFVGKDYSQLSEVIDNFISILYPFQWVHTYIPIMSYQMIQYLQTFLPFINGIHYSLMPFVVETLYESEENVYIIYLEKEDRKGRKNQIELSENLRPDIKRKIDVEKRINETTPFLPKKLTEKLYRQLQSLNKSFIESRIKNSTLIVSLTEFDMKIRNAFIDFFASMFYDYEKYLCNVDDYVVFNSKLFIEEQQKEDETFYKEFTESQLFEQFIQSVLKLDTFKYFNMFIKNKKKQYYEHNESEPKFDSKITNTYYIIPPFNHINVKDINQIEKEIYHKYSLPLESSNLDGILKEEKRIVGRLNLIDINNFNLPQCNIYLLPETMNKKPRKSLRNVFTKVYRISKILELKEKANIEKKKKNMIRRVGEKELSEKEKDEMREMLKDSIIAIFKSDISVVNENKKQIIRIVSRSFGRAFLIKLIGQNKTGVKILKEDAFKLLYDIILNALVEMLKEEEKENNLLEAVKLFKASLFYGNNKKLIWNALCEKMKGFNFILKNEFWSLWVKEERDERKNEEMKEILNSVCSRMLDFQLEKDFIKKRMNKMAEKYLRDEGECEKFEERILEIISKKKY